MKNILLAVSLLLFINCSNDDDDNSSQKTTKEDCVQEYNDCVDQKINVDLLLTKITQSEPSTTSPWNKEIDFEYDQLNRLTSITETLTYIGFTEKQSLKKINNLDQSESPVAPQIGDVRISFFQFEYCGEKIVSIRELSEEKTPFRTHNINYTNNEISEVINYFEKNCDSIEKSQSINFEYNNFNNISKSSSTFNNKPSLLNEYEYDDQKSPFINFTIIGSNVFNSVRIDFITVHSLTNNVTSIKNFLSSNTLFNEQQFIYEYNENNYPTKLTLETIFPNNPKRIESITFNLAYKKAF